MRDFLESPLGVAVAITFGVGSLLAFIIYSGQLHHDNLIQCYNTLKDKSVYDILVLCKEIR